MTVKPARCFGPGVAIAAVPPCAHFSTRRSSRKSANSTCLVASSILPASSAASNNNCAVCCHAWHSWICSGPLRMKARTSASVCSMGPSLSMMVRVNFAVHPSRSTRLASMGLLGSPRIHARHLRTASSSQRPA